MAEYNTATRTIKISGDAEIEVISRSTPHTVIDTYDLNAENYKLYKGTGDTFGVVGVDDQDGSEQLGETDMDGNEVSINTGNELCNCGSGSNEPLVDMDIYVHLNNDVLEFTKDDT